VLPAELRELYRFAILVRQGKIWCLIVNVHGQ
jgi:hypothetical protein